MSAVIPLIDRCYLGTVSAPTGGEPRSVYSYATGTPVKCRVLNLSPAETSGGTQIPTDSVRIEFRRDSGVIASSRVQVYRQQRQDITAEFYEVVGAPKKINTRIIAVCKRTTGRSAS